MAPGFERDPAASGPIVSAFARGGFVVDGGVYRGLLLTPLSAQDWAPPAIDALGVEDLSPAIGLSPPPEFLILGTGHATAFPPRALLREIEARGIGVEVMDSKAAARMWGILRGEDRWIAAAIMPL
jgi:uncharacterized protein